MKARYEWDVECYATCAHDEWDAGDVIDHDHWDTYAEARAALAGAPVTACVGYRLVLVRDDENGRAWAYMDGNWLPESLDDALGDPVCMVPARFVREVARWHAAHGGAR